MALILTFRLYYLFVARGTRAVQFITKWKIGRTDSWWRTWTNKDREEEKKKIKKKDENTRTNKERDKEKLKKKEVRKKKPKGGNKKESKISK